MRALLPTFFTLVFAVAGFACSDEGEDDEPIGGSTSNADGGASSGGAPSGGSNEGGLAPVGGAGEGGAGGDGTGGGSGGEGGSAGCDTSVFGPCHCITDDFSQFDPAATDDYWALDGAVEATPGGDPAAEMTPNAQTLYAGLYTDGGMPLDNCFASVRLEQQGTGLTNLELLEATGTGPKVILEVNVVSGEYTAANVFDAGGNGELIGSGVLTSLEALRIQVLNGQMVFEVLDDGTWTEVGTLTEMPDWMSGDVNIGFGTRDDAGVVSEFDDFNLDAP